MPLSYPLGNSSTPEVTKLADATTPTQQAAVSNTGALKVDASAVTQPVSNSALSNLTFDGSNNLKVNVVTGGSGGGGGVGTTGTPNVSQIVDGTTTTQKVAVSSSGALKVDPSAVTQPVSNSALTSLGSAFDGSGNVKVNIVTGGSGGSGGIGTTGTPNVSQLVDGTTTSQKAAVSSSGALKVDGSGVTSPVSIASLPALVASSAVIGITGTTTAPNITTIVDGTTPTQKISVSNVGALKVDNSAVIQSISYPIVTKIDRSGSITTGSTAQQLMPANSARKGWWIQNTSSGDLWINELGATAVVGSPSLRVVSGALYENPTAAPGSLVISIIGATTGQTFTAREW